MHTSRRLQEIVRDSSLYPKADISASKPRQKTSMGPPPPVAAPRPFHPSARFSNANFYRPKNFTPALVEHEKASRNDSTLSNKEVSLAGILKRSRNYDSANESGRESERKGREFVPKYKKRKVEIANPLYEEYKDCTEASRNTLENEGRAALNSAFEDLTTSVNELGLEKEGQIETIKAQLSSVLSPVETVKTPGGKTVDVVAELEAFRKLLEEEEKGLEEKWDDWERVQEEISILGVQVLGDGARDVVPDEVFHKVQVGYKSESETWMKELEEELKRPMEEIRVAGEEAVKHMAAAEKECDQKFNQQKVKIVAAITMDDD